MRAYYAKKRAERPPVERPNCVICNEPLLNTVQYSPEPTHKKCRGSWSIPDTLRQQLYERDGWLCQICEIPIDPNLPYTSQWSASLDHIVPRVRDGAHTAENLRSAHRWCNSLRGAGTLTDKEVADRAVGAILRYPRSSLIPSRRP